MPASPPTERHRPNGAADGPEPGEPGLVVDADDFAHEHDDHGLQRLDRVEAAENGEDADHEEEVEEEEAAGLAWSVHRR